MISIHVDEALSFDVLSVLEIKSSRSPEAMSLFKAFGNQILGEIGPEQYRKVLASEEYSLLLSKNLEIFNLIDRVKAECPKDSMAYITDACNYDRFVIKSALQKKFFSSEITENKYGYKQV